MEDLMLQVAMYNVIFQVHLETVCVCVCVCVCTHVVSYLSYRVSGKKV